MRRKVRLAAGGASLLLLFGMFISGCATLQMTSADVVGTWHWFTGEVVTIAPDGTMTATKDGSISNRGSWRIVSGVKGTTTEQLVSAAQGAIQLNWENGGWVDTLTLSVDKKTLQGTNQEGSSVTGTR